MHKTDLREFDKHMERLITMDTFDIDGDETTNSLLIMLVHFLSCISINTFSYKQLSLNTNK